MGFNLSEIASHVRSTVLYEVSKLRIDQTLDLLIEQFYANGYLIDWLQFYDDAVAIGWKCETILKRIGYAFEEVFSLDESERIIASLKRFRTYPTVSLMKTLP